MQHIKGCQEETLEDAPRQVLLDTTRRLDLDQTRQSLWRECVAPNAQDAAKEVRDQVHAALDLAQGGQLRPRVPTYVRQL